MGGLGTVIGDLARKITPASWEESISKAESKTNDAVGSMDAYFRAGGEYGDAFKKMHMDYQVARAAYEKQLDEPVNTLQKAIFAHKDLYSSVNNDTTLADIYQQASAIKHPIAAPGGILSQIGVSGAKATDTLGSLSIRNIAQARVLASAKIFGPNMEKITPLFMKAYDSGDPVLQSWTKGAMNIISNETHDTADVLAIGGGKQPASIAKYKIAQNFRKENLSRQIGAKLNPEAAAQNKLPTINISPTMSKVGPGERRVQNLLRIVQLPFVALKHISAYGNLSSIPAPRLARALLSMSDKDFKNFLDASSILAYTDHDIMDRAIRGGDGAISKLTGRPSVGQMFFNSYHMPFFDYLRTKQLSYAASVGYLSIHDWFSQAMRGSKIAIANLKELGIELPEIIKQGGIPTDEQIKKGMFHFVNNRFFMDKSIEQSLFHNKNIVMRSATMYHTYVNAQQRFMRRELAKMWKAGDVVGIAQFAGTIGILWPAIAPMVDSLGVLGRTLNPQLAAQNAESQYQKLGSGNIRDASSTYLDLLAHYAAFGVYTNYIAAAHGDRFAYALMGPNIGVGARAAQDLLNFVTRTNAAGKHNAAPLVRDALEDTIPLAGNVIAHHVAPTEKEQSLGVHRPRKPRRSREDQTWEF
jgi:hypothetical protein